MEDEKEMNRTIKVVIKRVEWTEISNNLKKH